MIYRMIWRNLWRNSRRTWITTASITFSVFLAIAMKSFQKGAFDNLVANMVNYYSGYIQVHQRGYWDERVLENCFEQSDSLLRVVASVPGIDAVVPRLETFVLASVGEVTKGCLLTGTDPVKEASLTHLDQKLVDGSYFLAGEEKVLLAEGLARRLGIKTGDTLVLFGQGYQGSMAAGKYPVTGIVHFAAPQMNDNMLYLPLSTARYFLNAENRLTSLSLKILQPDDMRLLQQELSARLDTTYEVMTWQELMPEISSHIKADTTSSYIYSGILYLIIGFGFFGTILMMTAERRYEFGMLVAIGMKKTALGWILVGETFLITLLGILFGYLVSLPFVFYFQQHPIRFSGEVKKAFEQFGFEPLFPTAFDPAIFLTQSAIVLVLASIIGLYPFWHVRRLDPVKAMK